MASPTQFRHYLIAQDAAGANIEVVRSAEQVCVLAFDSQRLAFVHCHVLLEGLRNRRTFDERGHKLADNGHPLLARLFDFGEDEGSAFYITENVDGETLSNYLSQHEELPVWLATRLTVLSLQAVRAAIELGDFLLSPVIDSLRLIQTGPNTFQVKLADFRIADEGAARGSKARLAKDGFNKQSQFIQAYLAERQLEATRLNGPVLQTADFAELLQKLLSNCGPGLEQSMDATISSLLKNAPEPPAGEIAATLKPKALVSGLLAGFQEIARSVVQSVRIQSQKLDAGQPYSMRGLHLKTGQNVLVEQVAPRRLAGGAPHESLQQVKNLPRTGKFPNLVPITFIENNEGIECVVETAVEGVPLNVVLDTRHTLDVQEAYLVLAGVDAALAQLEKASLSTPRLRLEDIFLFTGFTKQSPHDAGLLTRKLNEWPGFSIVLRTHPTLHAMAGRGTDSAILLPLQMKTKGDAEPLWNGAWMAALGSFLVGMSTGVAAKHQTGVAETDTVYRLLDDEISRARKDNPSNRASFLARFARVMQQFDLAQFSRSGGFWTELSGSATAQGHAAEVSRAATAVPPPSSQSPAAGSGHKKPPFTAPKVAAPPPEDEPEDHGIGFAEALIQQQRAAKSRKPTAQELEESSWMTLHEKRPFWASLMILFFGSLFAGMALAHLSGRAFWQEFTVPLRKPVAPLEPKLPEFTLPDAPKTPPASPPSSSPLPVSPPPKISTPPKVSAPPKAIPVPDDAPAGTANSLTARLQAVRRSGEKLSPNLRMEAEMAAKSGNTEAMIAVGRAQLSGDSIPVNAKSAFQWFDKAYQAGDPAAAAMLADCYLQGFGTPVDNPKAIQILSKAAQSGDAEAKNTLGVCYARGMGVVEDGARAFTLCQEAYKGGVVSACNSLGSLYLRGQGVAADAARAVELYAEGATRGHAESMFSYARSLENGTGTPASLVEATQWYQQAARLGNAEAVSWCREKNVAY